MTRLARYLWRFDGPPARPRRRRHVRGRGGGRTGPGDSRRQRHHRRAPSEPTL